MHSNRYKLLIIGNAYDGHIIRFIKNLKKENPYCEIDLFTLKQENKEISIDINLYVDNIIFRRKSKIENQKLQILINAIFLFFQFKDLSKHLKYDVINIHYPTFEYSFVTKYLLKITNTILLTPWGSDVYRIGYIRRIILKRLYAKANFISGTDNRFEKDVLERFGFSKEKFVNLDIGSETIDYITEHINIVSITEAKKNIGLEEDVYTIVCGYNGALQQNHKKIISAIDLIRKQLPQKLVLLFPITYGGNKEYHQSLKQMIDESHLNAIFLEKYLTLEELFNLRIATDMFIHIQTTDANSATILEYIYCRKKILNASWLKYDKLEKLGRPYYLVDNLDNLSDEILNVYKSNPLHVSDEIIAYIESYGWKQWIMKWNIFFNSCITK